MDYKADLQNFSFGEYTLKLLVPNVNEIRQRYLRQKAADDSTQFPYWAQVWPAATALAGFLYENVEMIKDKMVLELAAGLGLPSMVAALFAKKILTTDYLPEAVECIEQSAMANGFKNVHAKLLDWNFLPENLKADVLLLSDINYEPAAFEVLLTVLLRFKSNGTTIILSTPQRLMAKPFIERILPFCKNHYQLETKAAENVSILLM